MTAFFDDVRFLRVKFEADLEQNGVWVDYTQYLDNFSVYETTHNKISGIFDTVCDVVLNIPNPDPKWAEKGKQIRIEVSGSDNNWVTSYNKTVFLGSTSNKNSIPETRINIKATSYNSDFLDKKTQRQVFLNKNINEIITSLLIQVGVPQNKIILEPVDVILDAYLVNDNQPIRVFIEDLAKAGLMVVGFNREGFFVNKFLLKTDFSNNPTTPDESVGLNLIKSYKERAVRSAFYANSIKIEGRQVRYIKDDILYYNNQLLGYEILPQKKLFFTLEIPDLEPEYFFPFVPKTNTFGPTNDQVSLFDFHTSDDGVGISQNSDIQIISASIAEQDGKDVLFIVWVNTNPITSFFLKSILVRGSGLFVVSPIKVTNTNQQVINNDGSESVIEIKSKAIQSDVLANNISNLLLLNLSNQADVYIPEIAGLPNIELGTVLQIQTKNGQNVVGSVFEIDTVVGCDEGYLQTVTVKKLLPQINYFRWDDIEVVWDSPEFVFF